ncbi:polysaccharide deacetylase family protein [Fodinibius halophilus]|uniref:Polysaccharide deacetylase family protein n=1 Tax=Fodinibius halophilus TaxID=1736908 RepID=A0A6M1TBH8_9BACT|nr:polysaccharide deacetylase family protein [Fodinibius halophilus]NGP88314.1 polysaccharide deacetylase family protein [Fodinibius halophilus]
MNIVLTLDYELYFGSETGSVSTSIVGATEKLLSVLDKFDIQAVFFVDVGFVKRLADFKSDNPELQKDYELITDQLKKLSESGHDLQLHIHPHWEDSVYENGKWNIDAGRYRLADWSENKIREIVASYKKFLERFSVTNNVFVFRAGGWCIQPFEKIKSALKENGVWLDSTVYQGGYQEDEARYFDFRGAPTQAKWNFEDDPLDPDKSGSFVEIPISSYKVSPFFYWKLAFTKLLDNPKHKTFGDGGPLPASKKWILQKLLLPSNTVVSIDGYKASFLERAFDLYQTDKPDADFVIIGHPKALTEYSLQKFEEFVAKYEGQHQFHTFDGLLEEGSIEKPE